MTSAVKKLRKIRVGINEFIVGKEKGHKVHASKLKSLLALLCKFYGKMYHFLCKGSLWVYRDNYIF